MHQSRLHNEQLSPRVIDREFEEEELCTPEPGMRIGDSGTGDDDNVQSSGLLRVKKSRSRLPDFFAFDDEREFQTRQARERLAKVIYARDVGGL